MEGFLPIVGMMAFLGLVVGVPLSILRSLDEIKASQQRLEVRLEEIEARLANREGVT